MNKVGKIILVIMVLFLLSVTGCVRRETPLEIEATPPAATEAPTPTPEPTPAPLPYDEVASGVQAEYRFASDYQEAADALRSLQSPEEDSWTTLFAEGEPAQAPEAVRLQDQPKTGGSIFADGQYLYILSGKDLSILRADGEAEELLSTTTVGVDWNGEAEEEDKTVFGWEKTPLAVYPLGDRLAVVSDCYGYNGSGGDLSYTELTSVDLYLISDPASPQLLSEYGQDGIFLSAGIHNGTLHVLTKLEVFQDPDPALPDGFIPRLYEGQSSETLVPERILIASHGDYEGYSVIGTYDMTGSFRSGAMALLGLGPEPCVGEGSLYFSAARWAEKPSRTLVENGWEVAETAAAQCSEIYRIDVSGPVSLGSATVINGAVPGPTAMDVRDGVLRCFVRLRQGLYTGTSSDPLWRERVSDARIACYDDSMSLIGKTAPLPGDGNTVWAGFLRDAAVLTTDSDSSWLVSLSADTDKLPVTPLSDPVRAEAILPFGERGYMAFYRAADGKLTLSVRDGEMRELASRSFGSDHSNTLESRECYLSDESINLFGFSADDSYCMYGLDENGSLIFRKDVFLNDWAWNVRCFHIGGRLYVADSRELFVLDAETLETLEHLEL